MEAKRFDDTLVDPRKRFDDHFDDPWRPDYGSGAKFT
jgi:hypothetical protein|tara:strand:+ start:104 stop:214 length:111 start_codon:yes stop_codon:yes gene_type:complete